MQPATFDDFLEELERDALEHDLGREEWEDAEPCTWDWTAELRNAEQLTAEHWLGDTFPELDEVA